MSINIQSEQGFHLPCAAIYLSPAYPCEHHDEQTFRKKCKLTLISEALIYSDPNSSGIIFRVTLESSSMDKNCQFITSVIHCYYSYMGIYS